MTRCATCGPACVKPWCKVRRPPAAPDVYALGKPGVVMVRGYACTLIDAPSRAELLALAQALTLQANALDNCTASKREVNNP